MTQDDAHIFCTKEQMDAELESLLDFVLDLLRDYGLTTSTSSCRPRPERKAVGTDDEWDEATEALRGRGGEDGPRPRDGRRRRRVLRPQDLGAGARRHRPHVADVDDPARLPDAAALRDGVRRRRQRAPPADHDPPRAVRVDRAVLRHPRRALRRRVPGVAGAGAGHGAARGRPPRRLRAAARRPLPRRRLPRRDRRRARRLARRARAAGRSSRRCRTSSSSATTTSSTAPSA